MLANSCCAFPLTADCVVNTVFGFVKCSYFYLFIYFTVYICFYAHNSQLMAGFFCAVVKDNLFELRLLHTPDHFLTRMDFTLRSLPEGGEDKKKILGMKQEQVVASFFLFFFLRLLALSVCRLHDQQAGTSTRSYPGSSFAA